VALRDAITFGVGLLAWLLVAPSAAPAPFVHAERIPGIDGLGVPVIVVTLWGVACIVEGLRRG
jgi:hypothetical protein